MSLPIRQTGNPHIFNYYIICVFKTCGFHSITKVQKLSIRKQIIRVRLIS